ncbi:MAG: DEAD/DEAH box helicase [Planctomyces sp.]|jgi:ATP-dependent RNA helicase RhlE
MKFSELGLCEPLVRAVTEAGYSIPTPIQQQAIPAVLEGRDVVGIAQTGTGKTAAFALPLLHQLQRGTEAGGRPERVRGERPRVRPVRVLVLASTRELALQIHESFRSYGAFAAVRSAVVYGGVGMQPQIRALRDGSDIVVATPGRLLDLMQQGCASMDSLQVLVLDEADRMLDMGFLPAIRRVLQRIPKQRQTLLFSATMRPEIRELAATILRDPVNISIEPKQKTTELVEQSVCIVPQKQKTALLVQLLNRLVPQRAIVFSRTKHGADRIVRQLTKAGLTAAAIHANKSQNRRQRTLEEFRSSRPPILVATDIAARGIDVDQVSHVFNYDMPTEEETYVHRIGRSGRAGAVGEAVSLCDPEERRMLRSIEKLIGFSIRQLSLADFDLSESAAISDDRGERSERSGRGEQRGAGERGAGESAEDRWRFRGHEERRRQRDAEQRRPEPRAPRKPAASGGQRPERRPEGAVGQRPERRHEGAAGQRPEQKNSRRPQRTSESGAEQRADGRGERSERRPERRPDARPGGRQAGPGEPRGRGADGDRSRGRGAPGADEFGTGIFGGASESSGGRRPARDR